MTGAVTLTGETMEAVLTVIDAVIATKPVRWLMLVLVALLLVVSIFGLLRQKALSLQLSAAKGDVSVYAASLATQNAAIKKQGDAMQELLKKLQKANAETAIIREKMKKRQQELGQIILQGSCTEMVQQILDEVRK